MKKKEKAKESAKFNLRDLSIRKKLRFSFSFLLVLTVIVSAMGMFGLISLRSSMNKLLDRTEKANMSIKSCAVSTNIAARIVRDMALNDDPSTYESYQQQIDEQLESARSELKTLESTGVVSTAEYTSYSDAFEAWTQDAQTIIDTIAGGNREQGEDMILSTCTPALESLLEQESAINTEIEAAVSSSISQSTTTFYIGMIVMIALTIVSAIFAFIIAKAIIKSIAIPLIDIESSARDLSQGNLHTEITYESGDELGRLAESLRSSIRTLSTYVEGISSTMAEFAQGNFDVQPDEEWKGDFVEIENAILQFEHNMAETVEGLKAVSEQVGSGATQVSDSSMDLAEGATEQAGVMQEFTSTVESVSDQVAENADYAGQISRRVQDVGVEIKHTNDEMQEMVSSMHKIEESSQRIHRIIDTINDVAAQTNLLALNASIEAARAGEAGRGFAVVANQVTALATQSAEAAKESAELIEASIQEVENGMALTQQIAAQQEHVATDAQMIVDDVNQIAETLSAQNDSLSQLNAGISQINDVIQTNSATSQECAASSQEMSDQASTLGELIHKFHVMGA